MSNNALIPFTHEQFGQIRIVRDETGKPWFVAKDVAEALGYTNPQKAVRDHCKHATLLRSNDSFTLNLGRNNYGITIIPKADVYRLITRSKLPAAERFESWVFDEVLVSIDEHGMYATAQTVDAMLNDPDVMIRALTALKEERAARLEAERTKAHIGSKREATCVAKTSALTRELKTLKAKVELKEDYKTVSGIPWLLKAFYHSDALYKVVGMHLKRLSDNFATAVRKVPDTKYGTINAYHISVIERFRQVLHEDRLFLQKYRRPKGVF